MCFSLKNDNLVFKMKILKFLGILPTQSSFENDSKLNKIWYNYGLTIWSKPSTISEELFTHDHVSPEWSFDSGHFKVLFIFVGAPVFSPFERSSQSRLEVYRSGTWVKSDEPSFTSGQVIPMPDGTSNMNYFLVYWHLLLLNDQ